MTAASVATLAAMVGGRVLGDGERRIVGLGDLRTAGPEQLGFVRHPSYAPAAATTRAGALLLAESLPTEAAQIPATSIRGRRPPRPNGIPQR